MAEKIGFVTKKKLFRNIDTTRKYTSRNIGNIDDEYILVLQKKKDCQYPSHDDNFVRSIVETKMKFFQKQVNEIQGTSLRGKKPTQERLKQNIEKIAEAIEFITDDIKIK